MPPKHTLNKVTTYDLITYYDKPINKDNPELHVVRSEFQDEASALAEGKRLAVEGVYMFEVFAKDTYPLRAYCVYKRSRLLLRNWVR